MFLKHLTDLTLKAVVVPDALCSANWRKSLFFYSQLSEELKGFLYKISNPKGNLPFLIRNSTIKIEYATKIYDDMTHAVAKFKNIPIDGGGRVSSHF